MSYDKYKGYSYLAWTSVIFIIVGLGIVGAGFSVEHNTEEIIAGISRYASMFKVFGFCLCGWSCLGLFSIYGGCLIYFFSIASILLAIVFLALSAVLGYVSVVVNDETDSGKLTSAIMKVVNNILMSANGNGFFLYIQYIFDCQGHTAVVQTLEVEKIDCQVFIRKHLDLILEIVLLVIGFLCITMFLFCCPSCARVKSVHRFR